MRPHAAGGRAIELRSSGAPAQGDFRPTGSFRAVAFLVRGARVSVAKRRQAGVYAVSAEGEGVSNPRPRANRDNGFQERRTAAPDGHRETPARSPGGEVADPRRCTLNLLSRRLRGTRVAVPSSAPRKRRTEGITVRHQQSCGGLPDGTCTCRPSYQAQVFSSRDRRTIRRSFKSLSEARAWRADAQNRASQRDDARPDSHHRGRCRPRLARGS